MPAPAQQGFGGDGQNEEEEDGADAEAHHGVVAPVEVFGRPFRLIAEGLVVDMGIVLLMSLKYMSN